MEGDLLLFFYWNISSYLSIWHESFFYWYMMTFHSWIAIQDVPGARRRSDGETEAEANSHNLHLGSAEGARESFSGIFLHIRWHVWFWSMDNNLHLIPGDSLPWHLHPWRDCHEDRPHRSPSAGEDKWLLETYCPRPAIHCISTLYRNWQSCVGGALAADLCIGCQPQLVEVRVSWWQKQFSQQLHDFSPKPGLNFPPTHPVKSYFSDARNIILARNYVSPDPVIHAKRDGLDRPNYQRTFKITPFGQQLACIDC